MERFVQLKKTSRKKTEKKKTNKQTDKNLSYEEVIKRYEELSTR